MLTRTIAIPVAEIIEGGTKQEFYADLRESLDVSRRAANKAVSLCIAADEGLMTGGKCPKLYTYPQLSSAFPGSAIVAASIGRAVEAKYRQERWDVSTGRKSVCNYRSMPWPLMNNRSTKTLVVEDAGEFLTARIKLLGGWWTVRLAGGSSHRSQIKGIRNAIENGKIGDSKLWVDRKHKAILGVSISIPEPTERQLSGTLEVSSSREVLLSATKAKNETPFVITGDECLSWINERDRMYQRLRQDRKSGTPRQRLSAKLSAVAGKWNRRMDSYTHEVAAKIVNHAKRRRIKTVKVDMTIKSFLVKFPYFDLAAKIKYKCEDAGIEFVEATQAVQQPDVSKPHVYFKYAPSTGRVKIGKTARTDGGRHGSETDSSEELILLAVDNRPKSKLTEREKRYHAQFADHRLKGEWFEGNTVIHWLRDVGWFGNAGNLSQIAQVLPLHTNASETPASRAEFERAGGNDPSECSKMPLNSQGYSESNRTALETTEVTSGS